MSRRMTLGLCRGDQELHRLLEAAVREVREMTPEQRRQMYECQRESWVRGEMGLAEDYRKYGGRD